MKTVTLPCGESVPALGQGTWYLGDDPATRAEEITALQAGIDCGMTLIDTAEMYGGGRSETLVGEAIDGRREDVFLVSKVLPSNASKKKAIAACEASLERLGTECLDLYLLHWQGSAPYSDTIAAFEQLKTDGKIRHYGISNLDLEATREFVDTPGGEAIQTNQLLFNLNQRDIEWDLLPWLQEKRVTTMAYSPFDGGALISHPGLAAFAAERGMSAGQAALAWLLSQEGVIPIPKSANADRVAENAVAGDIELSESDRAELDALFSPPTGPAPLQIY